MPVILGYLPAGFAFGLMMSSIGQGVLVSAIMAVTMYAGAGQYIAVDFIKNNASFLTIAVTTFLVNSKHLFYGLSLIDKYINTGVKKLYLMFALTSELLLRKSRPCGTSDKSFGSMMKPMPLLQALNFQRILIKIHICLWYLL